MNRSEAFQQYQKSYRAGQKYCRACMISGSYPYIRVLDEILDESTLIGRMDLGVMEIPTELIIGTKHAERRLAFAANYMPLLPSDTEFAAKWISLCAAHLSEEGINDPISCYEYMGEFYVQEGHKRVSVLRSYGAAGVSARVVRLVPAYSDDVRVRVYYEFMDFFALTRLYSVDFRRPGGYAKLLEALGCEPGRTWTDSERQSFAASFMRFGEAFRFFTTERMLAQIDECYQIIKPEMAMHYDRWAEQNLKSISFDQPQTKDGCLRYWESRVERLRNVARKRPAYCWRQVAEYFKLTDAQMEQYFGPIPLIPKGVTWDSTKEREKAMTYLYGSNWKALYGE